NPQPFYADIYFDTVGDLDEGNVAVHAIVFTIEGHCAHDAPGGCSLAVIRNSEFFRFRDTTNRKVAFHLECVSSGLNDFRGFESDHWGVFYVKERLALQFVVFHAAAGFHTVCLNLDVQNGAPYIRGRKLQACVPFVEGTFDRDRRLDIKSDGAFYGRD